jgi:hypothetical protein
MAHSEAGSGSVWRRWSWLVAAALILVLTLAAAWWEARDPVFELPRAGSMPDLVEITTRHDGGRLLQHVTLSVVPFGPIGFTISLPDPLPSRKLPVVMVLGGLGTGEHNIRAIADGGENAIVGYDWPLPERFAKRIGPVGLIALRRLVLDIPGQVAAAWRWIAAQPWSDNDRYTLVGVSLGAIAAPAIQRVAAIENVEIDWTVLAFGGAPLGALVEADQRIRPAWIRPVLALGADLLLRPVDPAVHLPFLTGRFLTLDATEDSIVGAGPSRWLEELTPTPKQSIHLSGEHVGAGPDRGTQLAAVIAATCGWLLENGAINLPGPAAPARTPVGAHPHLGEDLPLNRCDMNAVKG